MIKQDKQKLVELREMPLNKKRFNTKYDGYTLYHERDVKQAVKEAYDEINNWQTLECIKNEFDPDNCSCIACVRDSMRLGIKQIFKDKFGFNIDG